MSEKPPLIEVRDLHQKFGDHHVLRGVSTHVKRGETLVLLMGMMFQNGALFDFMTVGQNIAFPLRECGLKDEEEIRCRVLECLDIVKLPGQENKMPSDLSGGMRKRVALARVWYDKCDYYPRDA